MKNYICLPVYLTGLFLLSSATVAHAQWAITPIGTVDNNGGINTGTAISADGTTIVGAGDDGLGNFTAFRWTDNDGMVGLDNGTYTYSSATLVNHNGSIVAGLMMVGATFHSFVWTQGTGIVDIGNLGGANTAVKAMSNDGTVLAGNNSGGTITQGFRWTQAGGMISIGDLGSGSSRANGISGDGNVIYGYSSDGATELPFRWTLGGGMVSLGTLGGTALHSEAIGSNYDGSVIVGTSDNGGHMEAFRWIQGSGMSALGVLSGGLNSYGRFVSNDGSVVVGISDTATTSQVFRWTQGTGIQAIGNLGGYSDVLAVSSNASVIYGEGDDGVGGTAEIFRWTTTDGLKSLRQVLTDAGVDLTGWTQFGGFGVVSTTPDGNAMTSTGIYNGAPQAFLFSNGSNGGGGGIITPEELIGSLTSTAEAQQQLQSSVVNGIGQTMFVARNAITGYFPTRSGGAAYSYSQINQFSGDGHALNTSISPSAGGPRFISRKRKALYALGNMGLGQDNEFSNHSASGATGMLVEVADHLAVGAGVVGSTGREETHLDGHNRTTALGGNIIAAYEPPSGLRLYGTATVASLDLDTSRHYMNGGGVDGSKGETDGIGYGAAVRAGYEVPVAEKTSIMPYTEVQASHTKLDGYTETGGGFPAVVGERSHDLVTSRLGAEVSHDLTNNVTVRGRGAWGHRYTNAGSTIATSASITQVIPGTDGDRDWAEAGLTMNYAFTDQLSFTADIGGRAGKTADPAVNATVGLIWRW